MINFYLINGDLGATRTYLLNNDFKELNDTTDTKYSLIVASLPTKTFWAIKKQYEAVLKQQITGQFDSIYHELDLGQFQEDYNEFNIN